MTLLFANASHVLKSFVYSTYLGCLWFPPLVSFGCKHHLYASLYHTTFLSHNPKNESSSLILIYSTSLLFFSVQIVYNSCEYGNAATAIQESDDAKQNDLQFYWSSFLLCDYSMWYGCGLECLIFFERGLDVASSFGTILLLVMHKLYNI